MSKLLIVDRPMIFLPILAKKLGENEALLLQQFITGYFLANMKKTGESGIII